MKLEELNDLTLTELKRIAQNLSIKGFANFSTKDKLRARILEEVEELGIEELPDFEDTYVEEVEEPKVAVAKPVRIKDFPRKKVIVESRDSEVFDYPFSVNEFNAYIQMGKEVSLPVPVINHIESLTEPRYIKDPETGFTKHDNVKKFFVRYV